MNEYATAVREAFAANGRGTEDVALARYEPVLRRTPGEPRGWQALGLLYRTAERSADAVEAFMHAAALSPHDALIANGSAQVRLEAGLDAVPAFEHAVRLQPTVQAIQGLAAAYVAVGDSPSAAALLDKTLAVQPLWGEGHWLLARLRWMAGDHRNNLAALDRALAKDPRNAALWLIRIAIEQRSLAFEPLLATLVAARRVLGADPSLASAEAAALSELGQVAAADAIFTDLPPPRDTTDAIYRIRHLFRAGRADEAAILAEKSIGGPDAAHFWPYLALAWRVLGDPRYAWLEGDRSLIGVYDLAGEIASLPKLAACLRDLHARSGEPLEQSVRRGTQTDGPLFSRLEPEVTDLRKVIVAAAGRHLASLSLPDSRHPQLKLRRDRPVRFAGAWSVRLTAGGHHVGHIHPEGWFSSAFYVTLPDEAERGAAPAGWLELGTPDAALGLSLEPLDRVEPKPGRLVLFPSTLWHGVHAFAAGERISVAFDLMRPGPRTF